MSSLIIEVGNTTTARLSGVKSEGDDDWDNGASIELTLLDKQDTIIVGPVTMINVAGGVYEVGLAHDIPVECGHKYKVRVLGTYSSGARLDIRDYAEAVARTA